MKARLNAYQVAPEAMKPFMAAEAYLRECGLEHSLIHLVKMRASQINGCAYCLDMHSHDARKEGESEERLYMLNAWQDRRATHHVNERARTDRFVTGSHKPMRRTMCMRMKAQFSDKEIGSDLINRNDQWLEPYCHRDAPVRKRKCRSLGYSVSFGLV